MKAPEHLAHGQIALPAILLAVVGGLDTVFAIVGFVVYLTAYLSGNLDIDVRVEPELPDVTEDFLMTIGVMGTLGTMVVLAAIGAFVFWGAWRMHRMESHPLAVATAAAAMVPSACCILGVPLGIWALLVLYRPEVRDAFNDSEQESDEEFWGTGPPP